MYFLFCYGKRKVENFSLQYAFNLEVPLLEDYRGQLRGARGNSWGCQQRRAILETKFLSFLFTKVSRIAYPLFPSVCQMHMLFSFITVI